jgi:hypothetical protein
LSISCTERLPPLRTVIEVTGPQWYALLKSQPRAAADVY